MMSLSLSLILKGYWLASCGHLLLITCEIEHPELAAASARACLKSFFSFSLPFFPFSLLSLVIKFVLSASLQDSSLLC